MIIDIVVGVLALAGTIFVFLAAVGMVRMPDTYLRISVTTKAATLGIGLLLIAAAIYSYNLAITAKILAILLFILLTAPVSAHLIGRTSYFGGTKLWKNSVMDELEGKYDKSTEVLRSDMDEDLDSPKSRKKDQL